MVNVSNIVKKNDELLLVKRFIVRSLNLLGRMKWLILQDLKEKEKAYQIYQHFHSLQIDLRYMEVLLHSSIIENIIKLAKTYYENPSSETINEMERRIEKNLKFLQSKWELTRLN